MELQGKTALITGAARRIGREIALTLAASGATVLIHYHRSRAEALKLQKEIRAAKGEAALFRADLNTGSRNVLPVIQKLVRNIYRDFPSLDILINNASMFYPVPFGKITDRHWDSFLTLNLKTPFFLAQEIGRRMAKNKSGKIINLVDWTTERPGANFLPYAIAKGGLVTATKGLAKALAPHVQVNAIAPGPILRSQGMTRGQEKAVIQKTVLKHFGNPGDIAETVKFLCEGTDFITGAVIPVEGGAMIS